MKLKNLKSNLLLACSLSALLSCAPKEPGLLLPVYGEKKEVAGDTVYHTIGDFSLVNQYGETISRSTMAGKICVSNFFFATCKSICPEMSTNLTDVQKTFEKD